ncbi:hypothetical protein FNB79_02520 [Formosa sediminum]|uniref:Uncharacterized protein n=1 Tax=Formosa sediminum TaxID=2594004 RepID=A0A516GN43_9FLAO|nr:hypothetical protein [Formosa sediminum]QDO92895.1 hypothetical protein FNB79_02520 [Formosa sediminum]
MSSDITSKVESENKSFVSDVVDIMGSSDDDDTKKSKILNRKKTHDGMVSKAFGDDNVFSSYKKKVDAKIQPFKWKYKMASLVF